MIRQIKETFYPGKGRHTVKVQVHVDHNRCDSRNMLGVIIEVDLIKDL